MLAEIRAAYDSSVKFSFASNVESMWEQGIESAKHASIDNQNCALFKPHSF